MVARILVAVLLSLAGAPVVQADSLSVLNDFCEGVRLQDAAFERWADDLPEGNGNWGLIESHRAGRARIEAHNRSTSFNTCFPSDIERALFGGPLERAEFWLSTPAVLPMLYSSLEESDSMADARAGLGYRFMSVETLVLFTKSKIHLARAFFGALDVIREAKRLNIRD